MSELSDVICVYMNECLSLNLQNLHLICAHHLLCLSSYLHSLIAEPQQMSCENA